MRRLLLSIMATVSVLSRASAFLTSRGRLSYRASSSIRGRHIHFATTSLQVKHTDDDNREIWQPLTRTEIRRLKLADMREELAKRGLDTTGTRPILMERLLDTVDKVSEKGVKKIRKETSSEEGCPPLDPQRTYVLRIKGHSKLSYNSSGIGLVLYDAHNVREVWVARKYFPRNYSLFEADYRASILGLQCALEQGARKIVIQTDNNVMIKQVQGEYNIKKPQLQKLCTALGKVLSEFSEYEITPISSAENTRAKNLAQRAVATQKTVGLPEDDVEEEPPPPPQPNKVVEPLPEPLTDEEDDDLLLDDESPAIISPDHTYLLQFDGGARGNPGIAGSGMVLYDPDDMSEVWCGWKYLGDNATNNAAEYSGLLLGIQCARSLGVRKLRAEGDSLLIVRHMNGSYKAREPNLKKLLKACKDAIQNLEFFEIDHIPRNANARADQLANQAMDTRGSFGFDELD